MELMTTAISDEVKQELIEKYRDINVAHDWWDYIYEDFTKEMCDKGIDVDQIFFSGFWSQGDGACFYGSVPTLDFKKFMEAHDLDKKYIGAYFLANAGDVYMVIKQSGRYCHENTMTVDIHDYMENPYYEEEDPLRWTTYDTMQSLYQDEEFKDLEEEVTEIVRDHAHDLYKRLQQEYEFLTSDEVVWESIEANELHLQHEGV